MDPLLYSTMQRSVEQQPLLSASNRGTIHEIPSDDRNPFLHSPFSDSEDEVDNNNSNVLAVRVESMGFDQIMSDHYSLDKMIGSSPIPTNDFLEFGFSSSSSPMMRSEQPFQQKDQSFASTAATALSEESTSSPLLHPSSNAVTSNALVVLVENDDDEDRNNGTICKTYSGAETALSEFSDSVPDDENADRLWLALRHLSVATDVLDHSPIEFSASSHLNLPPFNHKDVVLFDRAKELGILREEYDSTMQRAEQICQAPEDCFHSNRDNLKPVLCIAGKSGVGKTALVHAFVKEMVFKTAAQGNPALLGHDSTNTNPVHHDKESYFLFGKFDWPAHLTPTARRSSRDSNSDHASMSSNQLSVPSLSHGTFEEQRRHHEPLAAFCMVLNNLLKQIQARGPTVAERIRTRIHDALMDRASLNSCVSVLGDLSPALATFLVRPPTWASDENEEKLTGEEPGADRNNSNSKISNNKRIRVEQRLPRLKFVLRQLFRAVCDGRHPCVLVLDDAHWADKESLELARYLHADIDNPFFMLVLTWRTSDIQEEESCYTAMGSKVGVFARDQVKRVNLQNLSIHATTFLVADALQLSVGEVIGLAQIVHEKTAGNPFLVRHFLEDLEQKRLLWWRQLRGLWRWDEAKIAQVTAHADVSDLVKAKLRRIQPRALVVIQILSCLGSAFDEERAAEIVGKMNTVQMFDCEISYEQAMACVNSLVRDGYLVRNRDPRFGFYPKTTFSHEQIQEAAFQLLPPTTRPLLHLRIGERFLEHMEDQSSSDVDFLGVDLCSRGLAFLTSKERMGLALYNLLAGEKCIARASFANALSYFEFGLSALRVNDSLKGRLSLELSFGAMESAFVIDDYAKVRLHYDRISDSGCSADDKIRAHILLIRATGTRGDTKEALATGYRVLRSLGINSVVELSNKVSLYVDLRKTRMMLRKYTAEALSSLHVLEDRKLIQAMSILDAMLPFAYLQDKQLFTLLVMKAVRWSVKYGICGQSPMVFACLGSTPAFQAADRRLATVLGQCSLLLLKRFTTCDYRGMVSFLVHSQILNLTLEPSIIQRNLEAAHRSSIGSGDTLSACCSLAATYATAFEAAREPLDKLEILGERYSCQMKEDKHGAIGLIHDVTWQCVLNLRGDSTDPRKLTGRAMNQVEALLTAGHSGNELLQFTIQSRRMQLCYLMDEYARADVLIHMTESTIKNVAFSPLVVTHVAYASLNSLSLCASNGCSAVRKNAHYNLARQYYSKLHGPLSEHLMELVRAEFCRVEGNYKWALQNFEGAMQAAGRRNNLRDKGLACELTGLLCYRDLRDEDRAGMYLDLAIQSYNSWGATVLVNKILTKHRELLSRFPKISDVSRQLLSAHCEKNVV